MKQSQPSPDRIAAIYARVSTDNQCTQGTSRHASCDYSSGMSGSAAKRKQSPSDTRSRSHPGARTQNRHCMQFVMSDVRRLPVGGG